MNLAERLTPVILATWELDIRRIRVQGQPGLKIQQDPISTNEKLSMVMLKLSSQLSRKCK
jgi:hypothetical protein